MSTRDKTPSGKDDTPEPRLRVVGHSEEDLLVVNDQDGDYNIKILQPLFGYIRHKHDDDTLADIVHDCGLPPSTLERQSGWISHERFEHVLAATRELVESDEEFIRACSFEFKKQYGPFLLIMRSMSVRSLLELAPRSTHMVCRVGRYEVVKSTRTNLITRYYTERAESRLVCLSRQAAIKTVPTLFLGMPPANLIEHSCIAHGDDHCEYEVSWYEPLRLRLIAAGMLAGALVALGMPEAIAHPSLAYSVLPLLGGTLGAALELRRVVSEQAHFANKTTLEMEKVIVSHAQATDELTSLRERERDWNRHVEEGVAARTRKLNAVIDRLRAVIRNRSGSYPVVQKTTGGRDADSPAFVEARPRRNSGPEKLASMETAVDRVSQLVGELVNIASDDTTKGNLVAEEVSVDRLVAQIRRQLKATMIGRNVRITVFQTREAPATINTIRQILDRVIDNVLLNASRHTERGSVVVEASGTPGSLLIKLSDTGSGISKERLEQVFDDNADQPSTSGNLSTSNDRSGLAYAARLLDHLGGRLEIMSEPGVGTTLWLYIPAAPAEQDGTNDSEDGPREEDSIVGRVVRIRSNLNPAAVLDPET